jgi:hypothetical protein
MAQGGRNNFGDGGVTLITQGKNKGKYHLRLGSGENRKTHIGTKDKLDLIFKNRKTAGGDVMSRLDKVKNPKGYLTQSQFQTFLKENNINAESSGSSFAKNHGVNTKVNPLQKNTLLYDTGQFTEEFIETVQKAQVKSGVGTEFARDKFPPKTKSELNKIRQAEIEAQGGIKKNSPFAGKKKLKVDLGHTGDYKTELVTGDKLAYTPSKVNAEMGKKGNLDDKIRAVKKKQNKALETLEGDDLKKILNETDATLTRLADQSSGFKSVVLSNGKKYGGDRLTIDPFNVYPGKTEVEIRDIQNKYSNKKIITEGPNKTSPAEIQKIQDAYFFEKNRKSNLKTASKIGKKEQTKFIERMMSFCPVGSKRIKKAGGGGAGPTCSIEEAQAGLKKQVDAAAKVSKNGKIPKRFGKLRSFLTFAFGIADVPIETLLALPRITAGNYEAAVDGSLASFLPEKFIKSVFDVDNSGAFDLEKLKDTDPKVYQYLKDKQAQEEYTEAINTMDELYPFLDKAQAEGTLDKVNPEVLEQYRNAKKKSESIIDEYEEYGYVEESSDTPLTGKLAFQKYLRDKVKSDFERRQDKIQTRADKDYEQSGLVFDKDPNKKEIKYEDRYTAPTDLKSFIDQKGELGKKSNFLEYSVRDEADRIGESNIFDNYIQGADNKDERDLYSELPIEYANQLAALEKEELNQGLKSKGKFNTRSFKDFLESQQMDTDELYAQGGLASLKRKL